MGVTPGTGPDAGLTHARATAASPSGEAPGPLEFCPLPARLTRLALDRLDFEKAAEW